jgi:hypothetical protein
MMKMKRWFTVFAFVGGLAAWVGDGASVTAQPAPSVESVPPPAGANSSEPQLTASARGVLLSWVEHDGPTATLKFAERTSSGWTDVRLVASGKDWSINALDVPSVLRLRNGMLVAHWMEKGGAGMHANVVRLSYSTDEGRTWGKSFSPHAESIQAERLFASLVEMPGGGVGLVWLEALPSGATSPATSASGAGTTPHGPGRQEASAANHEPGAQHAHPPSAQQRHEGHGTHGPMRGSGAMTVRFAAFDGAWKPIQNVPIDTRVCECCPTAVVVTSDGPLVAYRDRSDTEVRDIYVSRFDGVQWTQPAAAHADNWRIEACPINGPALTARGRDVALAWFTVKQDQGQAYVAFSRDAGRSFGTPVRIDDGGSLGRVDVEFLPDGSAVATWLEVVGGRGEFRTRRVTRAGEKSTPVSMAGLAANRNSGYPRVASSGEEVIFAWSETVNGLTHVRTAAAPVSSNTAR